MTEDEINKYIEAASSAVGLAIAPEHKPGVATYFAIAEKFSRVIDEVELTPHDEPAVAFSVTLAGVASNSGIK